LIVLSSNQSSDKLIAISFDTVTYQDLQFFLQEDSLHNYTLERINPFDVLSGVDCPEGSYINLITKDMSLRASITQAMDQKNLCRFSFIHDKSYTHGSAIGPGCMIYPTVTMYTNTVLEKDVIVHSQSWIAHNCQIGTGSYIGASVSIAGTAQLGNFCQVGIGAIIFDEVAITEHTVVGSGAIVRKSILESGTYINPAEKQLTKIK
jgi:carbonic anhydrase/acetyltransferase-like protein (isoleucine patch superfamily)